MRFIRNPIARKRLQRFKEMKRAYVSLWILGFLYGISLCAELICNNTPLYVHFQGRSYFPVFRFYPEDTFTGSGKQTRPDYPALNRNTVFHDVSDNYMIFPFFASGPYESLDPNSIALSDAVKVTVAQTPIVGSVDIRPDDTVRRNLGFGQFVGKTDREIRGMRIDRVFDFPEGLKQAVAQRFANQASADEEFDAQTPDGRPITISLSRFAPRSRPPKTVRLILRERIPENATKEVLKFTPIAEDRYAEAPDKADGLWRKFLPQDRDRIHERVQQRVHGPVDSITLKLGRDQYKVSFGKDEVRFPYPPVKGHPLGIDSAGRDVLARILYGMRWSMSFGLLLVFCSFSLGILAGSVQGYYGGLVDITAQRLIEIWSALPFLYIMILMGSIYGRSFSLLLFCYGLFNWIGISYYVRAEFLRLRKQPFVEAAKCMGITTPRIIYRHILPNGMVPVITFFPFSLVGAIGSLAALDYLGFGLPPPTPSWGELLFQAQQYRWAWWLILYPSLALFIVMLLGVFVGEGIRDAYDPKRFSRLEG